MKKLFSILVLLFNESDEKVFGQILGPIQTDRPDQTETPFTVPDNRIQIENGFSFEKLNDSTQSFTLPTILFKLGLNERFEIGIISEFTVSPNSIESYGLNPVTVRFKEKITDEKGVVPTTSFIGYLAIPQFATENYKAKWFTPAFRFTMQHTLTDRITLGYNIGAQWEDQSPEPIFIYTLTTGISLTDMIGAYAEIYGFVPQESGADHRFDGGFTFLLHPNLLIDISGGAGINEIAPDFYGAIGFSFRIKD